MQANLIKALEKKGPIRLLKFRVEGPGRLRLLEAQAGVYRPDMRDWT